MAKKKKSKLKKFGTALAAGLAGAALLGRNREKPLVPKYFGGNTTGDANIAENIANWDRGMNKIAGAGGVANLKKGGRVGVGIAKRGFGRAMKKGRK